MRKLSTIFIENFGKHILLRATTLTLQLVQCSLALTVISELNYILSPALLPAPRDHSIMTFGNLLLRRR